jgi:hypothetical protein
MPTTQRSNFAADLSAGCFVCSPGLLEPAEGFLQQDGCDSPSWQLSQCVVSPDCAGFFEQQVLAGVSGSACGGSGNSVCEHPHPLERHFASEPQQQT